MRRFLVFALLAVVAFPATFAVAQSDNASPNATQNDNQAGRSMNVPRRRRRRVRGERHRRHRSATSAYRNAGRDAASGATGFGRNVARGKPVVAGRQLGKGMGRAGANVGRGTARAGKRVGRTTRRIFTGQ